MWGSSCWVVLRKCSLGILRVFPRGASEGFQEIFPQENQKGAFRLLLWDDSKDLKKLLWVTFSPHNPKAWPTFRLELLLSRTIRTHKMVSSGMHPVLAQGGKFSLVRAKSFLVSHWSEPAIPGRQHGTKCESSCRRCVVKVLLSPKVLWVC